MLYQLKRAGISQLDLVKIYVSVIRPVGPTGIRMPGLEYKFAKVFIRCN